jgi:hypothetical protein
MKPGNSSTRRQYARNRLGVSVNRHPDWQRIWERLRKLGIEFSEDSQHRIAEGFESLYHPSPIGWRPLLKRYVELDLCFHVHLGGRRVERANQLGPAKLCATFEWPRQVLLKDSVLKCGEAVNIVEPEREAGEGYMAVLVGVPQFLQDSERFSGRVLPAVKRLQPLDVCAQSWPDSPEAIRWLPSPRDASPGGVSPTGVEGVDGEANFSPWASGGDGVGRSVSVGEGELPDQMIERGAEVVDHFSDDGPPQFRRWLPEGFTVEDYLACLQVTLGINCVSITIDERLNQFVQGAQVHIRPVNLGPTSVQGVGHGTRHFAKGLGGELCAPLKNSGAA